jgi:hypothetical protein
MTLNGETTKTKVVYLKKLNNFVVDNFFIYGKMTKTKVVALEKL